ncbi:hypothetical protein [Paraburkholderia fungorum]|jgi:hypothetical protein|uniref:hypothetical protein n=1 Tax=Paraburkholderia fungorum TaxID=134537 RepID=UPI00040E1141|nr:hypothetical protein [Paraburkholderia fungorum]PZR48596.1 MAG: hypothetical protein DI523_10535 [Paraburkholderia fungorum]
MFETPVRIADALLTSARLMNPEEVRVAMEERGAGAPALGGWFLCGDVSAPMFDAMTEQRGPCGFSLTALTHVRAGNYFVFAQQRGIFQHRFLLPLFESPVPEFLASLRDAPIQVAMGDAGEERAAVAMARIPWSTVEPIAGLVQSDDRLGIEDMCSGIETVVARVCQYSGIELVPGQPAPRDLSVSVLLPSRIFGRTGRVIPDRVLH